MIKKCIGIIMALCILFSCNMIYAHPTNWGGSYSWGEGIGWSIIEGSHANSTRLYYKFDTASQSFTTSFMNTFRAGASRWSSYGSVSELQGNSVSTPLIMVRTYHEAGAPYGQAGPTEWPNSNGHASYWMVELNTAYTVTAAVCAHEIGHVFGLGDLYQSQNYNKLMCGYGNMMTATAPTTADIKGYNVITGKHTSHTIRFIRVPGAPLSTPIHRKQCTVCDIYKDEQCNPTRGTCRACKFTH